MLESIRKSVRFQVVDLLGDEFPAPNLGMAEADIILCRNLFIYLDPAAIQAILKKLTACLADGGFLLCAPGELLGQTCTNLVTRVVPEAVIYQKTQQTAMAYRPIDMTARAVVPSLSPARSTLASPTAPIGHEPQGDALAQAWARANRVEITKARKCCEKLQQQTPMNPEIHYLQAVLALAEDQRGRAREALRRVLYLQADFAAAYPLLIDLALAEQDRSMAMRVCRQDLAALEKLPSTNVLAYLGDSTPRELTDYLQARLQALENPVLVGVPRPVDDRAPAGE